MINTHNNFFYFLFTILCVVLVESWIAPVLEESEPVIKPKVITEKTFICTVNEKRRCRDG